MTSVEKSDVNIGAVVKEFVEAVKDIAGQVKSKNIVLYPYAHLSSNLASPEVAMEVLDKAEKELSKIKEFTVSKAPFGYYKEFELKVKGHPLSELSREIRVETKDGKPLKLEEKYDTKKLLKEISKTKLDNSKLKENDHRIIGKQMDLFSFSEVAPGMVFWHPNGLIIKKFNKEGIQTIKVINDKYLRFNNPEASRHLDNQIDQKIVDTMSTVVTKNYRVVQDFYKFKKQAKLYY